MQGAYILGADIVQGKDSPGRHSQPCLHVRSKSSGIDWMTCWDRELGEVHFPGEGPVSWLGCEAGPSLGSRETWSFHGESQGWRMALEEDGGKDLVGSQNFNAPLLVLWWPKTKAYTILLSLVLLDIPLCNRSQIIPREIYLKENIP